MKKHATRLAALGTLMSLAGGVAHAQTGSGAFQVTNLTLSGGDPEFSINSDVTFTNLALTEVFTDGTKSAPISLFDFNPADGNMGPQTSLDTGVIELDSRPGAFLAPSPTHGAVTSALLTGTFDNGLGSNAVDIQTALGGPLTNVAILPNFTATLAGLSFGSVVDINAVNASSGALYGAGQFSLQPAAAPEPSSLALLGVGVLGVAASGARATRRRAAKSILSVTGEGANPCA